ncbi:HD domain-containing protein [Treponema sp. R6D11]
MNIREKLEQREHEIYSKFATFSDSSERIIPEHKCEIRTEFMRDRDRIIHSKAFRRLKSKTQVFTDPNDHARDRLTHTLEVAQIARTIARCLKLNEDLTESIALGHDLGHTPFGHAGEEALDAIAPLGFKHSRQSGRIAEQLNLTLDCIDGIVNHTGADIARTLEGRIIKYADRIAYINHDIEDAIDKDIISIFDLPKEIIKVLGNTRASRIDCLIKAVVAGSGDGEVKMLPEIEEPFLLLRQFMFENVYAKTTSAVAKQQVKNLLQEIYDSVKITHPHFAEEETLDYISGMTDKFALDYLV